MIRLAFVALGCICVTAVSATTSYSFNLSRAYAGDDFFADWDYFNNYDNLTLGNVTYIPSPSDQNSGSVSDSTNLTYINNAGNAIIKVDNTVRLNDGERRNSVRITSKRSYSFGSMWIVDALHVPFGCSVWPAFWSWGRDWPKGGEIDVIEGVHNQVGNRVAMHTESGCAVDQSDTALYGTLQHDDCNHAKNNNSGCSFLDPNSRSYGAEFAKAGGGIWVTMFLETEMSIWFFSRADIPEFLLDGTSLNFKSTSLGLPVGKLSNKACDISGSFSPQSLIFDITVCGQWAGLADTISTSGCDPLYNDLSCYSTYVREPANYDNAYFEIRSLKVFTLVSETTSNGLRTREIRSNHYSLALLTATMLSVGIHLY